MRFYNLARSLAALVFLLSAGVAALAAPVNDDFADAIRLSGLSDSTTGSSLFSTMETGEPFHALVGSGKSVWWKWRTPVPHQVMEVNTIGSSFDTVLAVYLPWSDTSPEVGSLIHIAHDDQSGGNGTSKLTFKARSDKDYYIAVDGYDDQTGSIKLRLVSVPPPANDNFASAFPITGLTNSVIGQNTNATGEVGEPEHGSNPIPRSVWWRWVAPTNWVVRVDTFGSQQSFSPHVTAYQGSSVSALTRLGYADRYSRLTFRPQTGQAYYFAVDGWYGDCGGIVLNLQASPPPTNDAVAAATLLTGYTNSVSGDNTFATQEPGEPIHSGSTAGKSVWYRWTAPTNWAVAIDSSGSMSPAIAVYRGNLYDSIVYVATQSLGQVTFTATRNETYYIAVDSQSASSQSGPFTLNLRTLRPPTNDTFATGITLTGTNFQVQGSLLGARREAFEPAHPGGGSVWYRWVAPRTGRVRLTCFEQVTAYFGISLSSLTGVSRSTPNSWEYVFDAVGGTQYKFAVSGSPGLEMPFGLELTYGPPNDDFAAAIPLTSFVNSVQASTIGASVEYGEPIQTFGNSAWWSFTAPTNGAIEVTLPGQDEWPMLWIFEGTSISNLVPKVSNRVPSSEFVRCTLRCNVAGGQTYYISAARDEFDFSFDMRFTPAAPNDAFAARMTVEPSATVAFGSVIGGSREAGEPGTGSNSVWWSWTPVYAGPVILTTYGSACDTMLSVFAGNTVSTLTQVAANDDCLVWTNNHPAAGWTTTNGPRNDVISRVRFNADNGVSYKIAVSMPETLTNKPGQVALNIAKLAIEDLVSVARTSTNADRSIPFTAVLRLANLQTNTSGRLRVRLVAQPGYSYRERIRFNCYTPNFTAGETNLGTFGLSTPGTIIGGGTTQINVSGTCPPPYEAPPPTGEGPDFGYGFSVVGILEEQQGTAWMFRDARMIIVGDWPRVGPFNGPGGGVILVSASLKTGNEVGFLDVKIGPPAAVRLGGAWRVSPTNFGELGELRPYTNYTGTDLRLAIRSTNFSIQTRPMTGFQSPPNQSVTIQPSAVVPLNLNYSVNRPLLAFDRERGFGISGTPGTTYRIQYNTNLSQSTWLNYMSLTLGNGTTWLPQTTNYISNRIYRAFWLSN